MINPKKHHWILKLLGDLMTPREAERQQHSFAYGNAVLSNPKITHEVVDVAVDNMIRKVLTDDIKHSN